MTVEELDKVFADTLLGGYDDDAPWAAVRTLHRNGSREIIERAAVWFESSDPLKRARAADIVCQLRDPNVQADEVSLASESAASIARVIESETDDAVLSSYLYALGHLRVDSSIRSVIRHVDSADEDIRYAVAWALSAFHENPDANAALVKLAGDTDGDVRDYALFALGVLGEPDTPELRDLLAAHIDDPHSDASQEAIAGLAKRRDARAVVPLLRLMESGSYYIHHEDCFEKLVGEERRGEESWGTQDFIDLLYERFPGVLPGRVNEL